MEFYLTVNTGPHRWSCILWAAWELEPLKNYSFSTQPWNDRLHIWIGHKNQDRRWDPSCRLNPLPIIRSEYIMMLIGKEEWYNWVVKLIIDDRQTHPWETYTKTRKGLVKVLLLPLNTNSNRSYQSPKTHSISTAKSLSRHNGRHVYLNHLEFNLPNSMARIGIPWNEIWLMDKIWAAR